MAKSPPKLRYHITDEKKWYAGKKKSVTIRHVSEHRVMARCHAHIAKQDEHEWTLNSAFGMLALLRDANMAPTADDATPPGGEADGMVRRS